MADKKGANGKQRRLRSRDWFDAPGDPTMAALYPRALPELRTDAGRASQQPADHRHRPDRQRPLALQPPSPAAGRARARRHPRRRRHPDRVPGPSHPGDRQAADGGARPQPRLSQPGREPVRLFLRRRRADHGLRQDHARHDHGRLHGQHSFHRAVGRSDARRPFRRRPGGFGHRSCGTPARSWRPAAST